MVELGYVKAVTETLLQPAVVYGVIVEGAAGAHTLTGIRQEDRILAVVGVTLALTEGTPNTLAFTAQNLTSEFSVTADDTIDNTGGTSLVDGFALVVYLNVPEEIEP